MTDSRMLPHDGSTQNKRVPPRAIGEATKLFGINIKCPMLWEVGGVEYDLNYCSPSMLKGEMAKRYELYLPCVSSKDKGELAPEEKVFWKPWKTQFSKKATAAQRNALRFLTEAASTRRCYNKIHGKVTSIDIHCPLDGQENCQRRSMWECQRTVNSCSKKHPNERKKGVERGPP